MPKLQASGAFAQALDDNARALNGAYWKVYAAGTTTQATTYSNALLTIANAWPVIGDAAGRLPDIYVAPGNYRIRVETAGGVLIAESDNNVVYGLDPGEVAAAKFKTVAILMADATMGYSLGGSVSVVVVSNDIIEADGYRYSVLASGATDEDLTTAGGVKLRVLPFAWGVCVQQFGTTGAADDNATFARFIAYLNANGTTGYLGQGLVSFSTTQTLTRGGTSIVGGLGGSQQTGSQRLHSALKWVGGASPMFDTEITGHGFRGFAVESNGAATDFIEINAGAARLFMSDVYFGPDMFTRSVMRCNGELLGYSKFYRVNAAKPAPKFIDLDGQGTAATVTTVMFTECSFTNFGTGGTTPWTVLHVKDETIEAVTFDRCLFIARGGLIVVDTTDTPSPVTINILDVSNCEFDNLEGASARFFKLTNVDNFAFDKNVVTGNGTPEYIADCVNTNVTSFRSNFWKSINYVFDLDATSKISGVGRNIPDWSATEGIHNSPAATYLSKAQSGSIIIDGANFATDEIGHVIVDIVTTGTGYTFNLDTAKPENWEPGQRFDITVRNVSGGAISTGAFGAGTFKAGTPVAPANGFSRTYSFRFNGTHAVEVGRTGLDIPN